MLHAECNSQATSDMCGEAQTPLGQFIGNILYEQVLLTNSLASKTAVLGLSCGFACTILYLAILIQYWSVIKHAHRQTQNNGIYCAGIVRVVKMLLQQ